VNASEIIQRFSTVPALGGDPAWQPVFRAGRPSIKDAVRHATYRALLQTLLTSAPSDFLVIKGPVLAQLVYPEPLLRPSGDLDIFVDFTHLKEWIRFLEASGFTWDEGATRPLAMNQTSFTHKTSAKIDLHWALALPTIPAPTFKVAWSTRRYVSLGDMAVPTLGPLNGAIHLILHFHQHVGNPRILLDFALWWHRFHLNLDDILKTAELYGLERVVRLAVQILHLMGVTDVNFPTPFIKALAEVIYENWMLGDSLEGDDLRSYTFHTMALLLLRGGQLSRMAQHLAFGPHRLGSRLGHLAVCANYLSSAVDES